MEQRNKVILHACTLYYTLKLVAAIQWGKMRICGQSLITNVRHLHAANTVHW